MSFGDRVWKLIDANTFNVSPTAGSGSFVTLALDANGLSFGPTVPAFIIKVWLSAVTLGGTRTVSIAGKSLGSIAVWPVDLAASQYTPYQFPSADQGKFVYAFADVPSSLITVGGGSGAGNFVGHYEIWASANFQY